jgi:hypothetical protein
MASSIGVAEDILAVEENSRRDESGLRRRKEEVMVLYLYTQSEEDIRPDGGKRWMNCANGANMQHPGNRRHQHSSTPVRQHAASPSALSATAASSAIVLQECLPPLDAPTPLNTAQSPPLPRPPQPPPRRPRRRPQRLRPLLYIREPSRRRAGGKGEARPYRRPERRVWGESCVPRGE